MSVIIQTRRDTILNWEMVNPVLDAGEKVVVMHPNGKYFNTKVGDGVSKFKDIVYDRECVMKIVSGGAYVPNAVITSSNKLVVWGGSDGQGSHGVGSINEYIPPTEVVFPTTETGILIDAAIFGQQACALFSSGNFYTWGYAGFGQRGDGSTATTYSPVLTATDVVEFRAPKALSYSVNETRMFIKKTDNYWYGTGYNGYGAVGVGTTTNVTTFTKLTSLGTGVRNLWNLGGTYGCTVVDTGTALMVAGYNGYGQLGLGNTTTQTSFVNASSGWGYVAGVNDNIIAVDGGFGYYDSAAQSHSMLTMLIGARGGTTGKIRTCGNSTWYQNGANSTSQYNTPYLVAGTFKSLGACGGGPTSLFAITDTNLLSRWGYNSYGQLGISSAVSSGPLTTGAVDGKEVDEVFVNTTGHTYSYQSQSYVKTTDGTIYCAGYNAHGQLGLGDTADRNSYTKMPFNGNIVQMSVSGYAGGNSVLALTDKGELYGIGYNGRQGISMGGNTVHGLTARNLTAFILN